MGAKCSRRALLNPLPAGGGFSAYSAHMMDLEGRHPATREIAQYFAYDHLTHPDMRDASKSCHDLAERMIVVLPDGPELTFGLRQLLLAKDAFVRQAIPRPMPSVD